MAKGTQNTPQGWGISEVERLVGLPRRYIQRACYAGKDGAGILAPATNGRERTYDVHDLATLFVVALLRDERYSLDHQRHTLGEVRDALAMNGGDVEPVLHKESELLREQLEEVADRYLRALALLAALDKEDARTRLSALLERVGALDAALGPDSEIALADTTGTALAQELLRSCTSSDATTSSEQEADTDRPKETP